MLDGDGDVWAVAVPRDEVVEGSLSSCFEGLYRVVEGWVLDCNVVLWVVTVLQGEVVDSWSPCFGGLYRFVDGWELDSYDAVLVGDGVVRTVSVLSDEVVGSSWSP